MLKIYGTSMSRAGRALWAAEELGVKFEHVPTGIGESGSRKPEFLKINPNGHVPAIDDDGTIVWESMAINLYLADKYGKAPLWPSKVEDRGHAQQWSFWAMTETEPLLMVLLMNRMLLPKEQRSEQAANNALEALKAPLKVLDSHLKSSQHLLGSDFSIADLNVASVLMLAPMVQVDMSGVPAAKAWLDKCLSRPAAQKSSSYK
ncbi:MAG: glutathione S-transferase family protein [Candidatus Binataceae bacterium]